MCRGASLRLDGNLNRKAFAPHLRLDVPAIVDEHHLNRQHDSGADPEQQTTGLLIVLSREAPTFTSELAMCRGSEEFGPETERLKATKSPISEDQPADAVR
jgi:hypothetical protein